MTIRDPQNESGPPIPAFVSYAREDSKFLDDLHEHISIFVKQGEIKLWSDREIPPGVEWEPAIDFRIRSASIIFLLVSSSFIKSDFCYGTEMEIALERHDLGEARVIPIVIRPCAWKQTPLAKLNVLPYGGTPISKKRDRDEAWAGVVAGIGKVISEFARESSPHTNRSTFGGGAIRTVKGPPSAPTNDESLARTQVAFACLVPRPGPTRSSGELDILVRNEGRGAAYDVYVDFDTGDGFPDGRDRPNWDQLVPSRAGDNPRRFTVKLRVRPPEKDDLGEFAPNQRRMVWCRVRYRDGHGGPHTSYFLFRLSNGGADRYMWKVKEEEAHANVPQICRHTRPEAPLRETDDFNPEIPAVDPRDELILEVAALRRLNDPLDNPWTQRSDLAATKELAARGNSSLIKGIERLLQRKLLRVDQYDDGYPTQISLEPAGEERAYRRIYPNYDHLAQVVFRKVCELCSEPGSETTVPELAEQLNLPHRLVEFIARRLHQEESVRVRAYADVVKVDRPDPHRCEAGGE